MLRVARKSDQVRVKNIDFTTLCRDHSAHILNLMIHLVGRSGDVQSEDIHDLTQEVFLIALRRLRAGEDVYPPRPWLEGIAVRVAFRARQTRWYRGLFCHSESPDDLIDHRTPDRLIQIKAASHGLYRMLDQLTEKKRVVFILHEIMGLSAPEIAAAVECPVNTVYARLRHARSEVFALNRHYEEAL